ncbi:hypothetical protein T08_7977 [Trichinella sp. T8]|nr:hypothetical protein T08_7977 [Trichinella sp. T8]
MRLSLSSDCVSEHPDDANLVYNSDRREPKETPSKNWKILCLPITFGVSEKRLREQIFDEMRSDTTTLV